MMLSLRNRVLTFGSARRMLRRSIDVRINVRYHFIQHDEEGCIHDEHYGYGGP